MRKLFIQTLFIMLCCMGTLPVAAQSMSDTQVLEYVKQGLKEGKDQRVLATETGEKRSNRGASPKSQGAL